LYPIKNINQSDSEYESDYWLEIADYGEASSEIDDDIENDADAEDVSHQPGCGRRLGQNSLSRAGRALSDVADYTKLN